MKRIFLTLNMSIAGGYASNSMLQPPYDYSHSYQVPRQDAGEKKVCEAGFAATNHGTEAALFVHRVVVLKR